MLSACAGTIAMYKAVRDEKVCVVATPSEKDMACVLVHSSRVDLPCQLMPLYARICSHLHGRSGPICTRGSEQDTLSMADNAVHGAAVDLAHTQNHSPARCLLPSSLSPICMPRPSPSTSSVMLQPDHGTCSNLIQSFQADAGSFLILPQHCLDVNFSNMSPRPSCMLQLIHQTAEQGHAGCRWFWGTDCAGVFVKRWQG